MTSLITKIQSDLIEAQKQRNEARVSTLRFLLSALKNREIELRPQDKELTEEEALTVVAKQVKQRRESILEFQKGGRQDLVDKEAAEVLILSEYLPQQLSDDEVVQIVKDAVTESGAKTQADMGKVMAILMPKVKGKADGTLVSRLVKEQLVN